MMVTYAVCVHSYQPPARYSEVVIIKDGHELAVCV